MPGADRRRPCTLPAPVSLQCESARGSVFMTKKGAPRCALLLYLSAVQRGSSDEPIRNSSTARAHWRPSRIAHTTSDWPRRMSPATNTFGTEVW